MKKYNVIDLFDGAGGLSYGFYKNDKFKILCANEIEKDMCETYKSNHRDVLVYNEDIKNFTVNKLKKDLSIEKLDIDVIIGGPPCQAYSTVGKRLLDDPRGKLFQEYYRIVKEANPKLFIFENVKGLVSMDKGNLLKLIISLFEKIGYTVHYKILNALDYGVPQNRERVIIVGTKPNYQFNFPLQTHNQDGSNGLKKHLTLADAISDLPSLDNNDKKTEYLLEPKNNYQKMMRKNTMKLTYHQSPNNNQKLRNLMKALPDGGTPKDVHIDLRPQSGYKNTYCKLWWNRPSTTITRNFSTPSSSRCIHPKDPRPLSPREAMRIQSFPDDYIFCGSKTSINLQIGNAVPPILSEFLAESTLQALS